jgi:hypothetical protein
VAVLVWNRVRRRWTAVAAVAVITALTGMVTLAALAGARRTSTSVDRALDTAGVADVSVDIGIVDKAHLDQVARLPEVAAVSTYAFTAVRPAGTELTPGIELTGVTALDDDALTTMDAPRYRAGRAPRPDRVNEIAVNSTLADHLHVRVGDKMTVEAYRQDQVEAIFASSEPVEPAGARIPAIVTGIADPLDAFAARGGTGGFGIIQLTRAAWAEYGAPFPLDFTSGEPPASDIGGFRILMRARLVHGERDAPRFLRDVFRIYGDAAETTFSEARPDVFRAAADSVRVQSIALLLFGLAAALAGIVGSGPASARDAADVVGTDDAQLRAMGLSRRQRVLAAGLPIVIGVAVGVVVAVIGALVASRWLPRGLAARFEPSPGTAVDATVLIPGAVLLLVLIGGRALVAAWHATRADAATGAERRPARLTAGLPPAAAMGAR